jgi:hypothetical protein
MHIPFFTQAGWPPMSWAQVGWLVLAIFSIFASRVFVLEKSREHRVSQKKPEEWKEPTILARRRCYDICEECGRPLPSPLEQSATATAADLAIALQDLMDVTTLRSTPFHQVLTRGKYISFEDAMKYSPEYGRAINQATLALRRAERLAGQSYLPK